MLSVKPWRLEALIRLGLGVLICYFMGALALTLVRAAQVGATTGWPWLLGVAGAALLSLGAALVLSRRPWPFEESRVRLMAFLACLYAGLALVALVQQLARGGSTAPSAWQMIVSTLSFQGAALLLAGPFLREHHLSWADGFGLRRGRGRAVLLGLLTAAAVLPAAWLLQWSAAALLTLWHVEAETQTAVQVLRDAPGWAQRLPLGVITILIVPPAEEMLFRGLLYPCVKQAGYPRLALWGTALMFAAIHVNLATFVPLTLLALVLVWLYEKTDNLLAPVVAHGLFNALNFAALLLFDQSWGPPR
jgi:hypothetical protein